MYLPQGAYTISQPLNVNNVKVLGAGEWYTVLTGSNVEFNGNQNPSSTGVEVSNLSLYGNVDTRNDGDTEVTGFNGGFSDSTISDVWIQNEKVGVWIIGPSTSLTLENLRIQDTTADGVNLDSLYGPVTDTTVRKNFLRNTQDDGLALWSENYGDTGDTLTHNTVDSPGLADNVGVYGSGAGDVISDNLLQDTVTCGGGIGVGRRFNSVPMSGTLTITGNVLVRTGQWDPGWDYGVGAIWFGPEQGNMDSTVATGVGDAGIFSCGVGFTINRGAGDFGWSGTTCGMPAASALWAYPSTTTFEAATVGQATPVQRIAILNAATTAATLGTITVGSGFTVTPDLQFPCGASLDAADGNTGSYWESQDGDRFPQTLTANPGAAQPEGSITLTLPPNRGTRVESLSVLGSTAGVNYTTLVPEADYTFEPSVADNSVTIQLPAGTDEQYLQLNITNNTGWIAAQISEFEIYG